MRRDDRYFKFFSLARLKISIMLRIDRRFLDNLSGKGIDLINNNRVGIWCLEFGIYFQTLPLKNGIFNRYFSRKNLFWKCHF